MATDELTILRSGSALSAGALVSAGGTFAIEQRPGGELALRDRVRGIDRWRVGGPSSGLVLAPEGFLVLVDAAGRGRWRSGDVDRRVDAAVVTDDGRLLLIDPDGFQRWSRDPVPDAPAPPATGDRMTPGQRLAGTLTSPNGKYVLSHDPAGETRLTRTRGGCVWSLRAGAPGAELTLGPDGMLRTGTDSTVLAKWTGRRIDPAAYRIATLIVGDDGDVVLVGADGSEVYRSGTAAEEARLDRLERDYARREREENARPRRPRGSGLPTDWFRGLDLDDHYSITLVRGVSAEEALRRLGVKQLKTLTYADFEDDETRRAFAVPIDGWTMVVELDDQEGARELTAMSSGTQAVAGAQNYDGEEFLGWAADGTLIAEYDWDSEIEERDDAIRPFMRRIGLGRYRPDDDNFLPPPVELACLIAGVRPRPDHFTGELLGGTYDW